MHEIVIDPKSFLGPNHSVEESLQMSVINETPGDGPFIIHEDMHGGNEAISSPATVVDSLIYKAVTIPSLTPSLSSNVQLSLTITYIVVFGLIFCVVYVQLWMIWYYRHKRLSHQTLFLFLCLVWSGLRTSLFSFYFQNCADANDLEIPFYWLLYCLPVCLQFSMLCLLLHFYAQVVFKTRARYETAQYKYPLRIFLSCSVLTFMAINLVCAILTKRSEQDTASVPLYLLYVRISLNEAMFLIYGILMSVCIYKMAKTPASRSVLEAKGTTVVKAVIATILINLLFLSRTVYNLISICPCAMKVPGFGYDWINVSDQADSVPHLSESLAYASFGLVLFVWEVLPISIVMILFRVKRLHSGQILTDFATQSRGSKVFFFDNPRRYDSEDDLSTSQGASSHQYDANFSSQSVEEDGSYSGTEHGTWGSVPSGHQVLGSSPGQLPSPRRMPPVGVYNSINTGVSQNPHAYHGNTK